MIVQCSECSYRIWKELNELSLDWPIARFVEELGNTLLLQWQPDTFLQLQKDYLDKLILCARQFKDNGLVCSPSKELIKGTCISSVAKSLEEGKGAHEWGIWILNEGAEKFTRSSCCV